VVKEEVSMNKIVIVSSVVAFAALVGCRSAPAPAPAPIIVTTPGSAVIVPETAVRPGFGRVESISSAPSSAAAAGGATMRRLGIKMEDGTLQQVDTPAGNIALGDHVELTRDGKIRH
jgi:hypothetical protein